MTQNPFIIFTLPRSRSAWLAHFLAYVKNGHRLRSVGHDSFSRCGSIEQCLGLFEADPPLAGTVETGAAFAFPVIQKRLPRARLLVVQRDPQDCLASLIRRGMVPDPQDWAKRVQDLWAVSGAGVRTIGFADLDLESCCRWIWAYCHDGSLPWDADWYEKWRPVNVQIDLPARLEELRRNAGFVEELKNEVREAANG